MIPPPSVASVDPDGSGMSTQVGDVNLNVGYFMKDSALHVTVPGVSRDTSRVISSVRISGPIFVRAEAELE